MTAPDYADLRRLLAGSGVPWSLVPNEGGVTEVEGRGLVIAQADDADASLIAAAVNALPALLDEREALIRERDEARAKVESLVAVHSRYFDLDGRPGYEDTTPEPEDVWRYDRDYRAALADGADQ